MKRPTLTNLQTEQLAYVEYLEKRIEDFKAHNLFRLITTIDDMAATLADDISNISKLKDDEEIDSSMKILGSGKSKSYAKFLTVLSSIKSFKDVYEIIEKSKTSNSPKEKEAEKIEKPKNKRTNIQDFVIQEGGAVERSV